MAQGAQRPDGGQVAPEAHVLRFAQALRQAMARNRISERKLAAELGITIGTTQKYFRYQVHPLKVATGISQQLARLLGITLDALLVFYETGEFRNALSVAEVASWLRSDASTEHLMPMLEAVTDLSRRIAGAPPAAELPRYEWPLQELEAAGVSPALRQRMGLGDEVMERLATTGEFDDELVEAFSVAVNLEEAAVRKAFQNRAPVT